jgi:hypothetical protein
VKSIALLGRQYTELGMLGLEDLPEGGAVSLCRGALDKSYGYVEPNEDAALVVRCDHGVLVAVTDGHNGADASHLTIERVREMAPLLIGVSAHEFRTLVGELHGEVGARLPRRSPSRTCLVIAAIHGTHCEFASFGDASLFRAGSKWPLPRPNEFILGWGRRIDAPESLWSGSVDLLAGERIAAVTDGITDFAPHPLDLHRLLLDAPDDRSAACALALVAMNGGAGDNVAAAVACADDSEADRGDDTR